jgi:predicted MFS family arabinose efflux permease
VQFRIVLGAGAIPSALVVYFMIKEKDEPHEMGATQSVKKGALVDKNMGRWSFQKTLIGTAGAWFWFDVAWYGTNIFAPNIMQEIFPPGAPLTTITLRSAILPCCGILGTLIGIPLLGVIGPQMLNTVGILVAAFLYCLFAWFMKYNPDMTNSMFFILCAVNFAMKGFPEIATYVLPVMSFPRSIRATYHGRSGSAGKVGAMLATFIFPILLDATSLQAVFISQAVACVLSAAMASFLVRPMSSLEKLPSNDGTVV